MSDADIVREALRHGLIYAEACDGWPNGPHETADHARIKGLLREGAPVALERLEALSRVHVTQASHDLLVAEGWLDPEQARALKDALERIAHFPFDVMRTDGLDLRDVKEIAREALGGVRGGEEQRT